MSKFARLGRFFLPQRKGISQQQAARLAALPTAENLKIPLHLAVIMDGNGRWAKKHGLPRSAGHRAGAENLQNLCRICGRLGIKYLTVYAFSTENWQRPEAEITALMELFVEFFNRYDAELAREGIRVRFCGERQGLSPKVQEIMTRAENDLAGRDKMQLIIAFNYGSRREIASACRQLAEAAQAGRLDPATISEDTVAQALYLPDLPDPDLVIRPSGEMRLSNFLLWQSAYAEFYYDDVLWPDFGQDHLLEALRAFTERRRRFGGI